jgi:hypothetical protein
MKQNALDFLQFGTNTKEVLREGFAPLIANVMKKTLSSRLKNQEGSGEAKSGSMVFTRMSNSTSNAYGTARTALAGEALEFLKVTVFLDRDREIINEAEAKDLKLYTIGEVLAKKQSSNEKSMIRELERAFFQTAVDAGTKFTPDGTAIEDVVEELVLEVENTKNDFIDGVDRDILAVVLKPIKYSALRKYIAEGIHNANINIGQEIIPLFNGVEVYSSIYLPTGVDAVCMVKGAVAEPVWVSDFGATKIPFSNAYSIELYYSYGVGAVMPDLIQFTGTYTQPSE